MSLVETEISDRTYSREPSLHALPEDVDEIPARSVETTQVAAVSFLDIELPQSELDLTMTFESILSESTPDPVAQKVHKRASNVMKLAQENEKLKEELRAMTERLEAAERRQQELRQKALRQNSEENETTAPAF